MNNLKNLKNILPDYPRTPHLSFKPNVSENDIVAKDDNIIFDPKVDLVIEEKIDGASCGMCFYNNSAIIRNRNHILRKGYKKDTAAKKQFLPVWGWFYENKKRFECLNKTLGFEVGVYGEWLYALHGICYDKLPDWFVAYDLYDRHEGKFINTTLTRKLLSEAGFAIPPLLHIGKVESWTQLETLCNEPSAFSTVDQREGIYLKVSDEKFVNNRFKMIRANYVQGCRWNSHVIMKNSITK